jgi:two-component sensor histidine kinase
VRVLARQLGGQLEMNAARGTAWRLAFKERK